MAISTCTACGEIFSSVASFDKHRVGSYGDAIYGGSKGREVIGYTKPTRRCLTPEEMVAKGMQQNSRGRWITRADSQSRWEREQHV